MNLLLLRGLMREIRHWGDFPVVLAKQENIENVVCLDLPGIGENKDKTFPLSMGEVVNSLRNDFLAIKGDQPWAIVGISLGGMIALEWQKEFFTDFKKIIIINSSALNTSPTWHRLKPKALMTCLKSLKSSSNETREAAILKMVSNKYANDPETLRKWVKIANECPMNKITAIRQLAVAAKFTAPKKLNIPGLVISSRADNMVAWQCSKQLAKRYNTKLVLHSSAGHELALDEPDWLAKNISQWL